METSVLHVGYALILPQDWGQKLPDEAALLKARAVQNFACHQEAFDLWVGLVAVLEVGHFVPLDEASGQEWMVQ